MVRIKCKVKGLKNLDKKLNTIIKKLPQTIEQSVEEILKEMRICAIRLERGHNSEGILCEIIDVANSKVKGRVYTDKEKFAWAMFEHWGTGDYREMPAIGTTKHFIETGRFAMVYTSVKGRKSITLSNHRNTRNAILCSTWI